jgi:hypothetical protein
MSYHSEISPPINQGNKQVTGQQFLSALSDSRILSYLTYDQHQLRMSHACKMQVLLTACHVYKNICLNVRRMSTSLIYFKRGKNFACRINLDSKNRFIILRNYGSMVNGSGAKAVHKIQQYMLLLWPWIRTLYECRSNPGTFNFVAVVIYGTDERLIKIRISGASAPF